MDNTKLKKDLILSELIALAKSLGPNAKMPTIRALCKQFDVAMATMQHALVTLQQYNVLRLEHGRGIFVSENVSALNIAVIMGCDMNSGYFSGTFSRITELCKKKLESKGCKLHNFGEDYELFENSVNYGLIQGVVLIPEATAKQGEWLSQLKIPSLRLSSTSQKGTFGLDYHTMLKDGVKELAKRGVNHIVCVSLFNLKHEKRKSKITPRLKDREIFEKAVSDAGFTSDNVLYLENQEMTVDGNSDFIMVGELAAKNVLKKKFKGKIGVIILDDQIASGFLPTILMAGKKLGEDFICVTHANEQTSLLHPYHSSIIRLIISPNEMAEYICDELLKKITSKNKTPSKAKCFKSIII